MFSYIFWFSSNFHWPPVGNMELLLIFWDCFIYLEPFVVPYELKVGFSTFVEKVVGILMGIALLWVVLTNLNNIKSTYPLLLVAYLHYNCPSFSNTPTPWFNVTWKKMWGEKCQLHSLFLFQLQIILTVPIYNTIMYLIDFTLYMDCSLFLKRC